MHLPRVLLHRLQRVLIVLFVTWHMAAIGIYTLPDRDKREWVQAIRLGAEPYIQPYLLLTSQWQNWGLFSQGSLTRVVTSRIDVWKDDQWVPVRDLSFDALPWWKNQAETSLLRSLEDTNRWPARERYLQQQCIELRLASGTYLHFAYPFYDPPMPERTVNNEWWGTWEPAWESWEDTWYAQCQTPSWVDPVPI